MELRPDEKKLWCREYGRYEEARTLMDAGAKAVRAKRYDKAIPKLEAAVSIFTDEGETDMALGTRDGLLRTLLGAKRKFAKTYKSMRAVLDRARKRKEDTRQFETKQLARVLARAKKLGWTVG